MPITTVHGADPAAGGGATVPSAPTGVAAIGADGFAVVSWALPAAHNSAIIEYRVDVVGHAEIPAMFAVGADRAFAILPGLTNGTSYTFTVTAKNSVGLGPVSAPSNSVIPLGVPKAAPTAVSVTPGDHSAVVTFTGVAAGNNGGAPVDGYRVSFYVNGIVQPALAATGTASPITGAGLALGTSYTVSVAAYNAVGYGSESAQSGTFLPSGQPPTVPAQVAGVTVTPGDTTMLVTWTTPGDGGSPLLDYTVSYVPNVTVPSQVTGVTVSPGSTQLTVSWATPANGGSALLDYTVNVVAGTVPAPPPVSPIDTAMTANLGSVSRDLGPNGPFFQGVVSSTYGARPDTSATQATAERALDARYWRIPVRWNGTNIVSSASGGPTGSIEPLIQTYYGWGHRLLLVIAGRTNDWDGYVNGDAGSIVNRLITLGMDTTRFDFTGPNEPNNAGHTIAETITRNQQIWSEIHAILPARGVWGPVWANYSQSNFQAYMSGMGADHEGLDYHHYAMGSSWLDTATAFSQTTSYATEVTNSISDANTRGVPAAVNVDELNWSWRYADGAPAPGPGLILGDGAGNDLRFFSAISTVWMASALGWVLSSGGRAMPYATQNGPLGMTVQSGQANPDGRPVSSPMPAFWGIAAWTGAGTPGGARNFSHMSRRFFATTSADASTEVFVVDNEAGGYNVVLINKRETATRNVQVTLSNLPTGTWVCDQYLTVKTAPYDSPVHTGPYAVTGNQIAVAMGACSVAVCVLTKTG